MVNRPTLRSPAIYGLLLVCSTAWQADADFGSAVLMRQSAAVGQLQDLKKRHTADALLKKAREALRDNNVQLAEFYVEGAERLDIEYESLFAKFNDTPVKVREALVQKKAELQRSGGSVPRSSGNLPSARFAAKAAYEQPAGSSPTEPRVPASLAGLDRDGVSVGGPLGKSDAIGYLQRGRKALASRNLVAAIGWYKSAAALGVEFRPGEYSPQTLHDELVQAGIAPGELTLSAATPDHGPPPGYESGRAEPVDLADTDVQLPSHLVDPQSVSVTQEDAVTSSSLLARAAKIHSNMPSTENKLDTASRRVRQLLAQADAALSRGELEIAEEFVLRAQEIQLPESAYEKGDRRPWMVLMEINRAHKRKYSMPAQVASNDVFGPPPVQQASGATVPPARPGQALSTQMASAGVRPQVTYGDYQPAQDSSANIPATAISTGIPTAQAIPTVMSSAQPQAVWAQGLVASPTTSQVQSSPAQGLTQLAPFAGAPIAPQQQLSAPSQAIVNPPQSFAPYSASPTSPATGQAPPTAPQFLSPPPAQIEMSAAAPSPGHPAAVGQPFVAAPLLQTSPPRSPRLPRHLHQQPCRDRSVP